MTEIPLLRGEVALVDDDVVDTVSAFRWYAQRSREGKATAVVARHEGRLIWMHRLLTGAPNDAVVDHVNRNPLDNRLCNLRLCSRDENGRNRTIHRNNQSGAKGVYLDKRAKARGAARCWRAEIRSQNVKYKLGYHETIEAAAAAYNDAALRLHGEFASLSSA